MLNKICSKLKTMKTLSFILLIICANILRAQTLEICEKDSLFGVCDSTHKAVIPIIYKSINHCYNYPNLYLVELKNKYGIINNHNQTILPIEYEFDRERSNPFVLDGAAYYDSSSLIVLKHKDKYGILKSNLKAVVPFEYEYLEYFYNYSSTSFIAKKKGGYGIIDLNQKTLTKSKYDDFAGFFSLEGSHINYAVLKSSSGKWVFVDKYGNEYAKALGKTEMGLDTIETRVQQVKYKGKFAAMDFEGKLFGEGYDQMSYFETDRLDHSLAYAVVAKNGLYGILRNDGLEIVKPKYSKIDVYDIKDRLAKVMLKEKEGLVDLTTGKEILEPIYDEVYTITRANISSVKKGDKYALVRNDGKMITDFIFESLQLYDAELLGAKQNGYWGYINHEGKMVIPYQFDCTRGMFDYELTPEEKQGKWGYINQKGETVIPFKYDKADYFYNKPKAEVVLDGKKGTVDKRGNETW